MSTFHQKPWEQRYNEMGDQAESVFEGSSKIAFARYGLDRPGWNIVGMPEMIRYTPDYITPGGFVEVMGFGKDQCLRLKVLKWRALKAWHLLMPLEVFIYDSTNDRHTYATMPELDKAVHTHSVLGRFPEGTAYFAVSADAFF